MYNQEMIIGQLRDGAGVMFFLALESSEEVEQSISGQVQTTEYIIRDTYSIRDKE